MRVALLLLLLVFYPYINVSAQKAKNVHGTAELILTGDMSRDKAVKQCIELAKINAIKAEFGENFLAKKKDKIAMLIKNEFIKLTPDNHIF